MHPNDPLYAQQWHLTRLGNIEKIWDEYSGAGVHVGIYDNGVESAHPDLSGNYDASRHILFDGVAQSGEVDPVIQTNAVSRAHGTAAAGIIGAQANNGQGGVGIAWGAGLTSVNIYEYLEHDPVGGADRLVSAIEQMVNFDVTNNSWNRTPPHYLASDDLSLSTSFVNREVNAYALASETGRNGLGTVIVQGIGNDNIDTQGNGLNSTRYTITVAGAGPDGFAAAYSSYGAFVLVTAPTRATSFSADPNASGLVTTDLTGSDGYNIDFNANDHTDEFPGTSGATPMVTGIVALMLQANPNLGWRDVQNILAASATHTGSAIGATTPGTNENNNWFLTHAADWNGGGMHFSNDYGYGMVNAYNAVRMAEMWSRFKMAQTTANEHDWSNWKWAGGNVNTGVAIPDSGAVSDSITLATTPFAMRVEHIDVQIDLIHPDYTSLRVFLVSPQGTEVQLYDGTGGNDATTDSGLTWTFGVDALRGELVSGNWTVRVEDAVGGETGMLRWFEVKVYGEGTLADAAARSDTYHYTDEFLATAALAGQAGRTTLADSGGIDWIDGAALTGNFTLDLGQNVFSTVNGASWFKIAAGTTIENAVTGDGNDVIKGNGAANTLYGMRGNDVLNGGAGGDALHGGKGSDAYAVDSGLDVVDERGGDGLDTVQSSLSFSLGNAARVLGAVENLTLLNVATAITGTGNGLANVITGNNFNNTLAGGGSTDRLVGGAGNDIYVLENGADIIVDASGTADLITSTISRSIAGYTTVERLALVNVATALAGTGNNLANLISGNNFANTLSGGIGNDSLNGGIGNDTLIGGAGIDTLTGGANNDFFVFNAPLSVANRDSIADFNHVADTFRLENAVMPKLGAGVHALNPTFFWAGPAAHDANDYVVYNRANGYLSYDANGNAAGGVTLLAVLTNRPVLAASDFVVI